MPDPEETEGAEPLRRFGDLIRHKREARKWTQDDLADKAGVSRPTVQRYERAQTKTPDPVTTRAIFKALGLDVRRIPVILGYLTAEEMGLPGEPERLDPTIEEIIADLTNPAVPVADKHALISYLQWMRAQRAAGQPARDRPAS